MATAATESYVDDHDMGWRGSSPLTGMGPDVSERRGPGSRRTKLMPESAAGRGAVGPTKPAWTARRHGAHPRRVPSVQGWSSPASRQHFGGDALTPGP